MGGAGTNSIAQVKAGTDTGTPTAVTNVSLRGLSVDGVTDFNDGTNRDIAVAGSSPDQSAPHAMSEFHGYVQTSFDGWPDAGFNITPANGWGDATHYNPSFVQVGCNYSQKHDTANDRIHHRWTTFTSASASSFSYSAQDYVGLDSATFQAKADYTTTASSGGATGASFENPASYSPASGTWANVSTSSYSPTWQWVVEINGGNNGTAIISSAFSSIYFYNRATLSGVTYPSTADGYNGNQYYRSSGHVMYLAATRGNFAVPR